MESFSFVAFISASLGAVVSTFGSEAVKRFFKRTDNLESSRDADINRISDEVALLRSEASTYWASDAADLGNDDTVIAAKIVASQQLLADLIAALFEGRKEKWDCDVILTSAFTALTGGEFMSPNRLAEPQRLTKVFVSLARLERQAIEYRRSLPSGLF